MNTQVMDVSFLHFSSCDTGFQQSNLDLPLHHRAVHFQVVYAENGEVLDVSPSQNMAPLAMPAMVPAGPLTETCNAPYFNAQAPFQSMAQLAMPAMNQTRHLTPLGSAPSLRPPPSPCKAAPQAPKQFQQKRIATGLPNTPSKKCTTGQPSIVQTPKQSTRRHERTSTSYPPIIQHHLGQLYTLKKKPRGRPPRWLMHEIKRELAKALAVMEPEKADAARERFKAEDEEFYTTQRRMKDEEVASMAAELRMKREMSGNMHRGLPTPDTSPRRPAQLY